VYHSTLGLGAITKKKKVGGSELSRSIVVPGGGGLSDCGQGSVCRVQGSGFRFGVYGLEVRF